MKTRIISIERSRFKDENEADKFMVENCLENGFYDSSGNEFIVYERVIETPENASKGVIPNRRKTGLLYPREIDI